MPRYIMTYHNAKPPASPEEGQAMMKKWQEWMATNSIALLEPQNPVGKTWTIDGDGAREGTPHPMMGYTVLEADNLDAALELVKSCPFLDMGTLEVSEIKEMG